MPDTFIESTYEGKPVVKIYTGSGRDGEGNTYQRKNKYKGGYFMETLFQAMGAKWPSAYVARTEVGKFTGGLISEKYLANLDCGGKGPAVRIRSGRKIIYPVVEFVKWLENRSEVIPERGK
jgi:hypothetical protein